MFSGYRTYLSAGIVIVHQLLKATGIDVPQENLSVAIDTIASIAAVIFRYKATK